jgi:hypothetical protein
MIMSVGQQIFHGLIYAPQASIVYAGDTRIDGGLFASHLAGAGRLEINGALPAPTSPSACGPDPTNGGTNGGTNGSGGSNPSAPSGPNGSGGGSPSSPSGGL